MPFITRKDLWLAITDGGRVDPASTGPGDARSPLARARGESSELGSALPPESNGPSGVLGPSAPGRSVARTPGADLHEWQEELRLDIRRDAMQEMEDGA